MKMSPGEIYDLIECVEDEDDDEGGPGPGKDTTLSRLMQQRAREADMAERFLGDGKKLEVPVVVQHYYENLLALALKAHLKAEKWNVVRVPGLPQRLQARLQHYKGRKIKYNGSLEFLQPGVKKWDDLSLLPELKEELMANTVGFLNGYRIQNSKGGQHERCKPDRQLPGLRRNGGAGALRCLLQAP